MKEIENVGLAVRIDKKDLEIISLLTPEDRGVIGTKQKLSLKLILPPITILLMILGAQFVNFGSNYRNNAIILSIIYFAIFGLVIYWFYSSFLMTVFDFFLPHYNRSFAAVDFTGTWITGSIMTIYLFNLILNGYPITDFFENLSVGYYALIFFLLLIPQLFTFFKIKKYREHEKDIKTLFLLFILNIGLSFLVNLMVIQFNLLHKPFRIIFIIPLIYSLIYAISSNGFFSYMVISEYEIKRKIKNSDQEIINKISIFENQNNLSNSDLINMANEVNNGIKNLGIFKETDFYEENENKIHNLYLKLKNLFNQNPRNNDLQEIMKHSFIDYLSRIFVNDVRFDNRRLDILNDFKKFSKKYPNNKELQLDYLKAIYHTISKLRFRNKDANIDNENPSEIIKIQKKLIKDAKRIFEKFDSDFDFQKEISKIYDLALKRNLFNHIIDTEYLLELQNLSKTNLTNYELHVEFGYITAFQVFNLRRIIRYGDYDEKFELFFQLLFDIVKDLIMYSKTTEFSTIGIKSSILQILSIILPYIDDSNLTKEEQKRILQESIALSQEMYNINKNPFGIQILYLLNTQLAYKAIESKNWVIAKKHFSKANNYWISEQKFLSKAIYSMTKAKIEQMNFLIQAPENSIKMLNKISKFFKEAHKEFKKNPLIKNQMLYQSLIYDCYSFILKAINKGRFHIKKSKKSAEKALLLKGESKLTDFLKKTITALDSGLKGSRGSKNYTSWLAKAEKEIEKAIEILPHFEYMPILTAITESVGSMTSDYITKGALREGPIRKINKRKIIFVAITDVIYIILSILSDLIANKVANYDLINLENIPYVVFIGIIVTLIVILILFKDK